MTDIVQRCQQIVARLPPSTGNLIEYTYYSVLIGLVNPDICLVSYPKSGRTWLRYLLANYVAEAYDTQIESRLYKMAGDDFPSILATHDGKMVNAWTSAKRRYVARNVVFLVRDPRDILVSHYHHKHNRNNSFDGTLDDFARHETLGIQNIINYLNTWEEKRDVPEEFLLIRYEDMQDDVEREARRVLSFLGEDIDEQALSEAIRASSFSNMKETEQRGESSLSGLESSDDDDGRKVRKGKTEGYKEELAGSTLSYVNQCVRDELHPVFDYD